MIAVARPYNKIARFYIGMVRSIPPYSQRLQRASSIMTVLNACFRDLPIDAPSAELGHRRRSQTVLRTDEPTAMQSVKITMTRHWFPDAPNIGSWICVVVSATFKARSFSTIAGAASRLLSSW